MVNGRNVSTTLVCEQIEREAFMKLYGKTSLLLLFLVLTLTACVPGNGSNDSSNLAGFFSGVWHGWIAPVSLIISIFKKNVGIYEIYNNGFFYDLGFYAAVISGFGGLALSRRRKKNYSQSD